ncbi:MAG: aminotransferase class V-fold PLP-dependent enzyme [Planctomycetota bacterium]
MTQPSRRHVLAGAAALLAARESFARDFSSAASVGPARRPEDDYDLGADVTYLNHASIGTVPRAVREAHARYLAVCETNPWLHVWGDVWREPVEEVHAAASRVLGVPTERVAVVRNTTAAFGMAANGLPLGEGDEVLFSSINHMGASASWEHAGRARGYTVRRFEFPDDDVASLSRDDVVSAHVDAIGPSTAAIVVPHVDNVYGVRHDVAAIARAARAKGVRWILVDGAQSVGMHPVDVNALGVDVYATSAHKWLQAPKGSGLMALSDAATEAMRPMVVTWGHGRSRGTARAFTDFGTRDLPKLLAIGDAISFHASRDEGRQQHHAALRQKLRERVDADERLEWRSPGAPEDGAPLVAVGLRRGSARDVARSLFEDHGVVVRGFEGGGRNHLRVSPNTMNGAADLERFFRGLDGALG